MLSNVTVTSEAYNSPTVDISWNLGGNSKKGITVESVVVEVNGIEVEVVDGDDLSVSIDLDGGVGDYEIQVYGKNAFSEEGNEMRSVLSYTVKETTASPSVAPATTKSEVVDLEDEDSEFNLGGINTNISIPSYRVVHRGQVIYRSAIKCPAFSVEGSTQGSWNASPIGTTVTVECAANHILVGNATLICQEGGSHDNIPQCIGKFIK
eukprot:sb/3470351/